MQTPFPDIVATATAYLSEVDPVMRATIERVGPAPWSQTRTFSMPSSMPLSRRALKMPASVRAADAIMARVRAGLPGGKVTPEALVPFDFDRLRTLGLSTPKARYILNLVEQVCSSWMIRSCCGTPANQSQLQLEVLSELNDEEIIRPLDKSGVYQLSKV